MAVKTDVAGKDTDNTLDFDLAFDEASNPTTQAPVDETDDVPPEEDGETDAVVAEDTDSVDDGEPADTEDAVADDVPPEEDGVAEPKVEAPVEPNPLEAKIAELERKLQEKEAPKEEPKAEEPKSPLNEDDNTALKAMKEDWPEMTRGVEAMMKNFKADIQSEIKQAVAAVFQQLAPALQTVESVATNSFLDQLEKKHKDAETIYPQVESWVKKQPGALSAAYKNILDTGTVTEVAEVFTLFKKATGFVERQPRETPLKREVPAEKSRKVEQMRTVKRERTGLSAEIDENDFDAAFERAAQS